MCDYYILNNETGKIELHFEKSTYLALSQDQKERVKSSFLWGRNSGCWISRCKWPNTSYAVKVAEDLGLEDAGAEGERRSFADQMADKAEKAVRRAERYEARSDAAEVRGEALQAPIESMRGDIAFFTQPNINTGAGRAFTNRRNAMWSSWERGLEEFNKSEYWQGRAKSARETSEQKELRDRAFVQRRIEERLADIRKLKRSIEEYEGYRKALDAGEKPRNKYGWDVNVTAESVARSLDRWLDMLEAKLDELGFYQDCMDRIGGVQYSADNIKPGYVVKVQRWGLVQVYSTGLKNFKAKSMDESAWPGEYAYAEILAVVRTEESKPETHPFKVGDCFNEAEVRTAEGWRKVHCEVVRATDKSVSISVDGGKPIVRRPYRSQWGKDPVWYIDLGHGFLVGLGRTWAKRA